MIITGIGSRETPDEICDIFTKIGEEIARRKWWMRSGGADGADNAFEQGAKERCIVYLPWKNFNVVRGPKGICRHNSDFHEKAFDIVLEHEPYAASMKEAVKWIKSRNVYQILGENLDNPSDAVICWTPRGEITGGTGLALKIAQEYEVPIFNFGSVNYSIERLFDELSAL